MAYVGFQNEKAMSAKMHADKEKVTENLILCCVSCTPRRQTHLIERFPYVSCSRFLLFSLSLLPLFPRLKHKVKNNHVR